MNKYIKEILDNFRINKQRENYRAVVKAIELGVVFRGTNLWVLVFAIFIASLGLNVNSPAVIIGAMLVSPLMGPIMGMGLAMGINDLSLLKNAAKNYLFAAGISLLTSTLYFMLSPINDAHSEILARTSPNIYDVLIAFVGGLAGILATASKLKGNVLPGVAIATALMPPLCTAGYGIATGQPKYFLGAFYLFIINTVFIALATLMTVRFLKFPFKAEPDLERGKQTRRIIWLVTAITILPSVYLGYEIVQQTKFVTQAEKFIEAEANFPGDFLLKKLVDPKKRTITLTYGGKIIDAAQIAAARQKLTVFDLKNVHLDIRQGFAVLEEKEKIDASEATRIANLQLSRQVFKELLAQYPQSASLMLEPATKISHEREDSQWLALLQTKQRLPSKERKRLTDWLKIRLQTEDLTVLFTP